MALIGTVLAPPLALLFLIGFMISEGYYVFDARVDYFGQPEAATRIHVSDVLGTKH
jgi:cytochrome c oxidase subunit IV